MRQYAWYSPEMNAIVLQSIMEDCRIVFEWDYNDFYVLYSPYEDDIDPMELTLWFPLGEL